MSEETHDQQAQQGQRPQQQGADQTEGGADRGGRPAQGAVGQATDQAGQFLQQAQGTVGGLAGGQGKGQTGGSGEQPTEDYSHSDSDTTTAKNDKTPKGPLAELLNLEILQPPDSDKTTLESGDSGEYQGPDGGDRQGEAQR